MFGSNPGSLSSGFPLLQLGLQGYVPWLCLWLLHYDPSHKITLLKTRFTGSLLLLLRVFCIFVFWGGIPWGIGEFPASQSGATKPVVLSGDSLAEVLDAKCSD